MRRSTLVIAAVTILLAACGEPKPSAGALTGSVNVAGSTALEPLIKAAKEQFETKNPNVTVNVTGGGSFQGLSQVASGAVEVGASDVPASAAQNLQNASELKDHQVAAAAFAIIVHPNLAVSTLSQRQVQDIVTGKVTNWNAVGGPNLRIEVILRPKTSGTRYTFKKVVLKDLEEMSNPASIQDSTNTVKQQVAQTPGAISYVALGAVDASVKKIRYDGVEASAENVKNGKYPIWSHEHLYTRGEAKGVVKAFLDYVLSQEFQSSDALTKLGFIAVKDVRGTSAAET